MPTATDTGRALTLVSARIPERYARTDLDDFEPGRSPSAAKALSAAKKFLRDEADNLVLIGPPGAGKTMLAAAICRAQARSMDARYTAAMERYEEAISSGSEPTWGPSLTMRGLPEWVNVPDALVGMRREFGINEHDVTDRIRGLRTAPGTLVLDDLGREKVSDWTAEVLYVLVNARYEAMLRTVVTCNLTVTELQDSGYWPVISRLSQGGIVLEVQTPDQRAKSRVRP